MTQTLNQGDKLTPRSAQDRLVSGDTANFAGGPTHHFELVMQTDGNLVVYRHDNSNKTDKPLWATGTNGQTVAECIMQTDGNLVLYEFPQEQHAVWASHTRGCGVIATMQDDGNFVIYDASGNPCWDSKTVSNIITFLISIIVGIYRAIINWLSGIFGPRR